MVIGLTNSFWLDCAHAGEIRRSFLSFHNFVTSFILCTLSGVEVTPPFEVREGTLTEGINYEKKGNRIRLTMLPSLYPHTHTQTNILHLHVSPDTECTPLMYFYIFWRGKRKVQWLNEVMVKALRKQSNAIASHHITRKLYHPLFGLCNL